MLNGITKINYKVGIVVMSIFLVCINLFRFDRQTINLSLKKSMEDDEHDETIWKDVSNSKMIPMNFINNTLQLRKDKLFQIKMKPGLMTLINPTTPKFTPTVNDTNYLENKDLCSREMKLKVLVMILSAPHNFQRRKVIRETWGDSINYSNYGKVRILFLLGATNFADVQEIITAEFRQFGDILQGCFIDSYHNLSLKSVLGFKWLTERCTNAEFIIKTDDDVVLDMFQIFEKVVPTLSVDHNHVQCERRVNSAVIRNINAKAYVEPHQLRGLRAHMPYCHGQYVMLINDIVPYLYKSALKTPFFWIDDVFNYGIVMNNIPGLKYKQVYSNQYADYSKFISLKCWKKGQPNCEHVYIVSENISQILKIYYGILLKWQNNETEVIYIAK